MAGTIDDLPWRKFPRNIIRNEELDYCGDLMGPGKEMFPLLFYTVAYCKADDLGVFDIEDGVIFKRLMKGGTAQDVHEIAKLLDERGLISCMENSTVYMIVDWEVPTRPGSKAYIPQSYVERRNFVLQQWAPKIAKSRQKIQEKVSLNTVFAPESVFKDKKVSEQREREIRETTDRDTDFREDKTREIKDTHTQRESMAADNFFQSSAMQENVLDSNRFTEYEEEQQEEEQTCTVPFVNFNNQSIEVSEEKAKVEKIWNEADFKQVCGLLNDQFVKFCIGYSRTENEGRIIELATRILKLADERNPPKITATVIMAQFKKLVESPGYYNGMQFHPEKLLKNGAWSAVLSMASPILVSSNNYTPEWISELKDHAPTEQERAELDEYIRVQCQKYGIDENDPQRMSKITRAQAFENTENVDEGELSGPDST